MYGYICMCVSVFVGMHVFEPDSSLMYIDDLT